MNRLKENVNNVVQYVHNRTCCGKYRIFQPFIELCNCTLSTLVKNYPARTVVGIMPQKPTPLGLKQVSCRRNLPHQDCSRYNEVETYPTGTVVGIRLISWTLHQWSFIIPAIRSWLPPPAIHSFIYSFIYLFIYSFIHLFIYSFVHLFIYSFIHLFIHSLVHIFICLFF